MLKLLCRKTSTIFVFCALLAVMSGCAKVTGHLTEQPKVSIADIQVQEVKNLETTFLVQLRVQNPNDVALHIKSIVCDLEIEGQHFASGLTGEEQKIPPYGTPLVEVNVYASMLKMVGSVINILQSSSLTELNNKPLSYRLHGTIRIYVSGFSKEIPFENTGELTINGIASKK